MNGDRLRVEAPRGVLTPDLRAQLVEAKPGLLRLLAPASVSDPEVARRLTAFRAQLDAWTHLGGAGVPLLVLPDALVPRIGACVSCDAVISEGHWRCDLCRRAVELALGLQPAEEPTP